ncbi:MAG: MBL fold metallo-hydrolase [Candidatus Thorarchaeota archaeon]
MKIPNSIIPKTRNKIIRDFFQRGSDIAEDILEGKEPRYKEGLFGEHYSLFAYELARNAKYDCTPFQEAKTVDSSLTQVFRDVIEEPKYNDVRDCIILGMYGMVVGNYTDEDFRYLYRYILRDIRNLKEIHDFLWEILSFLASIDNDKPEDVLSGVREWIRFLGAPLPKPIDFIEPCMKFGVNLEPLMNTEGMRFLTSLLAHPEYLEEAIQGRAFEDVYRHIKDWGSDVLQSKILASFQEASYKQAQKSISKDMTIPETINQVSVLFQRIGFQVSHEVPIPVKLQKLPEPPPIEAINPVVFEMIPQKLRMPLMTSVAYSTRTKKVEIIFLGGPRIGRSGILIKTATGGILLDYGLSVANHTIPEWIPELEAIDTVLISHSHLDHVGGLPILYENFSGKWCSTGVTGIVTMALLDDAIKVGTPMPPRKSDEWDRISLFTETNIQRVAKNHVRLELQEASEVAPGILATPIDACHIPGSVAYLIDIEGLNILYTGDFNLDQSVLFPGANLPINADFTIFDGTYWGREDFNRSQVTEILANIIQRKGPVIIPSFAVGRTQEMLKILDTLGITNSRNVIVAGMAEKVTRLVGMSGGWQSLKKNKTELEPEDILVAGGGMMGGGLTRYHFEQHRNNKNAAVIPCGYLAPRTPGWNLVNGYEPHECQVQYARLSAHSSASNLDGFVKSCKGKKIMVHTPAEKPPKGLTMPLLNQRITLAT